jgi:vacuolar-type H+-ATPase subunit E/Vma4
MTLDALAAEIASQAKAEAKSIIDAAKAEAKRIKNDAKEQAAAATSEAEMRASRDSEQLSVEVVASARQANQKRALIARREELDMTWGAVMEQVESPDFEGRSDMIASLLEEANKADSDMG